MLCEVTRSVLLVVDIQQKLTPAMAHGETVIANTITLMTAAARLAVPHVVSEQYPQGLGPSEPAIGQLAAPGAVIEKVHFSCLAEPSYRAHLTALNRDQAVVVGIEAHVCVLQTVLDLLDRGYHTLVVADAVSSRTAANHQAALSRMNAAGAEIVTTEMVLFEWLRRAATPEFQELRRLIV